METTEWTVSPLIRYNFSMIGSAVGGTAGAFYGFNHAMPFVRRWIKGPMWLHFLIGACTSLGPLPCAICALSFSLGAKPHVKLGLHSQMSRFLYEIYLISKHV
ncbi:uncharacterized protein [Primulina eburnea]|uniref:uncharacterized protein n=1 Tax=Primulina eburnea TaxID=1245227 RepID=UPI003C6C059A